METIKISVRALVEFLLRSGDLDNRRGGWADREAMRKGSRIHRKIQKQMGAAYQAEYALAYEKQFEKFVLRIEGRADGIFTEDTGTVIDEIKGTYLPLDQIPEPVEVHLAQAKCYAYIYGLQNHRERMGVQMTYCSLESEEIKRFRQDYTLEELDVWFAQLLDGYGKWADLQCRWKEERNCSMQDLEFPFPYRTGQQKLVADVYRTILRRKQLFVHAPTGVGKTMSTLFPAVRAVGEGEAERIFYLTAKTITRTVAEEALAILRGRGLRFKAVTLTAKEKMCVCQEVDCNPENCPRARGHFDRVNEAVFALLGDREVYDRETILAAAEQAGVCPYEFQLDLASWCDGIICDYNYVFDPVVKLRRFFGDGAPKEETLFLIDEAHNLVDRGREMFSAQVCKEDFLELKRLLKMLGSAKGVIRALEKCNRLLLAYKRECQEECCQLAGAGEFALAAMGLVGELEEFLQDLKEGESRKKVLEFYFSLRAFVNIYELVDENYLIYTRHTEEGRFVLKLFCVNPAVNLQECLDRGRSAIFFSATLLPVRYYKRLFSTNEDDYAVYVASPFDPARRRLLLGADVSSRYTRRGEAEYRRIAEYLRLAVRERCGNYMAFFPSYRMMSDVFAIFERECRPLLEAEFEVKTVVQTPGMDEREREEFLETFAAKRGQDGGTGEILLGFCVMGGVFAEGIDLDGERLIGAVVVGTGLPQVGPERELLRKFYDQKGENGFDYAYRFPGMNKVLQSAGRVIRTAQDRGVILLLDERFLKREYLELFPREWSDYRICTGKSVAREISAFWAGSV